MKYFEKWKTMEVTYSFFAGVLMIIAMVLLVTGLCLPWFSYPSIGLDSLSDPVRLSWKGAAFEFFFKAGAVLWLCWIFFRGIRGQTPSMARRFAVFFRHRARPGGLGILLISFLFCYATVNYDTKAMVRCKWLYHQYQELFLLASSSGFAWEQYRWHLGTVMDQTAAFSGSLPLYITEWRSLFSLHINDFFILLGLDRSLIYFLNKGWVMVMLAGWGFLVGGYIATDQGRVIRKIRKDVLVVLTAFLICVPVLMAPWLLSTHMIIEADKSILQGNIGRARERLDRAAYFFPSLLMDPVYLTKKGEVQAITGDCSAPEYHFYRATLFRKEGNAAGALASYREAVSLSVNHTALRFACARFIDVQGRKAYLSGQYGKAHLYFLEALSLADAGLQPLFHTAETAFQTGCTTLLFSSAHAYLKLQLSLTSPIWNSMSQLYSRMAWSLYREKKWEESWNKMRIAADKREMKKDINRRDH